MLRIDTTVKDDLKQFFIIAIPLSAAYLAEFAMFITTKMVVGKLGYLSLAAVGIAGDLTFEILVILMALLSIVGCWRLRRWAPVNRRIWVSRSGRGFSWPRALASRQ